MRCIKTTKGYVRDDAIVAIHHNTEASCYASVVGVIEGIDGIIDSDVIVNCSVEQLRRALEWTEIVP